MNAESLIVLHGSATTGVLRAGTHAILIDAADELTPVRLRAMGIEQVEMVCCTQHRRTRTAGARAFAAAGAQLLVPKTERHLFENADAFWNDARERWHIYHHLPGPLVPEQPLAVTRGVAEPEAIVWEDFQIQVLDTPGATDGSVSYLVEHQGRRICFCGDAVAGHGQLLDLYSLQKGSNGVGDYHSFLGNLRLLLPSLHKLRACGADCLVPAAGDLIHEPIAAIDLLIHRLENGWRSFAAISSINHYFPDYLGAPADDPERLPPVPTMPPPAWVRRTANPGYAIVSECGAALVIDAGNENIRNTCRQWLATGQIKSVEGCWVTHYHDDHTDGLARFAAALPCPVIAEEHLVEIIEHPRRFFLPCISPYPAKVDRVVTPGESWDWQEFRLTAFHLPGQTLYHAGLLVEGHGARVFFIGDSASPCGIDDHCCGNRNFLGRGRGYQRCLEIWQEYAPDFLINQHQELAFRFSQDHLTHLQEVLDRRRDLLRELLPWPDPDFGVDEWWCRVYPYDQDATPGGNVELAVEFTNHADVPMTARAEPVLPADWRWEGDEEVTVRPRTSGTVNVFEERPDVALRGSLQIPGDALAGRVVVPFRITVAWGDTVRPLGRFRHALITVAAVAP